MQSQVGGDMLCTREEDTAIKKADWNESLSHKERRQSPDAGRGKKWVFSWSLVGEYGSADVSISTQWKLFWTFAFQNCESINFCCFKLPFAVGCYISHIAAVAVCLLSRVRFFCDPTNCSLPVSPVCVISQVRTGNQSQLPFPPPGDLPGPGIEPVSCIGRQIIFEPPGKPTEAIGN